MIEPFTLKQSLTVRASMFTADELRRQKRLNLSEIDKNVLEGLVKQRSGIEAQQEKLIRSLTISLFLAFIAWHGGSIQIPGTGASIAEIPAFLELSLISAAFSVLMITYTFLSLQIYTALISAIASVVLAKDKLDPDLFSAALAPVWLFFKYSQEAPVIGREPGYKISSSGRIFYGLLVGSVSVIILALWFLAIASILYIAHSGLTDDLAGWAVYFTCIALICASLIAMAANILEFSHEIDFEFLEKMEADKGDLVSHPQPKPVVEPRVP